MNAIIPRTAGTGLISREDLAKSLNNAAMSMPVTGGEKPYLKMDRGGVWAYGQEETEVEEGSLWAANPLSVRHGLVAWDTNGGGAPVQEVMVPAGRTVPAVDTLPVLGLGSPDKTGERKQLAYVPQYAIDLVCVSGEDEGVEVEYKQSSGGALKLFKGLIADISAHVADGDEIVAVGKLTSESYKNKTYGGKTFNPVFEIVEWRTMDDTAPVEDKAPAAPEPEPSRRSGAPTTATATPPVEDTPEDDNEAALAAEYEAEQARIAAANPTPRRRVRR